MAFLEGLTILFPIIICFLIVLYISDRRNSIVPTNWPVLGAIPAIVVNYRRAHEYATDVLAITGGTFLLKGPMFAKMDILFTSCPAEIHHIMSKNFPNYPKGHKFRQIFDILGDGVSNSDGDIWQFHCKTYMLLFNHPSFHSLFNKTVWNKVEKGLLPLLDNISGQGVEIDLQDIFQRFGFDTICNLLTDYDPESMSLDFPYIPWEKALSHAEEAVFIRHVMPEIL
ncbi:putative cytochrome P450 superfamily [Helianthus annuus]|nr:putative cytochrome P450 superfamily [Helianthus annuus]KAJ0625074.1 putative cytochrome P450 superfamily [Helianthus annuus]KAJ0785016.1 putative cytochrome P450 superfamily [Helianthus annuus]KAJ0794279.1 putative cytochrome P450 superfamily [Helianthus annuus]KAJ0811031.1 putative cytochrome P450 superfamily [Helianthus annuus]